LVCAISMTAKTAKEKLKWEFLVNRAYLPFSISLSCFDTNKRYLDKVLPIPVEDMYASYKNEHFLGQNGLKAFSRTQIRKFEKDGPRFLWHMAFLCVEAGKKLLKLSKNFYSADYSDESNKEIADALMTFCRAQRAFSVFLLYPLSLGDFFDDTITKIVLKREKDTKKVLEWKKVLTEPVKMNEGQREQLAILKLARNTGQKDKFENMGDKTHREIYDYLKKYGWLQVRWLIGKPANVEDVTDRLKHLLDENNVSRKIKFLEDKPKKTQKLTKNFISKFKINKDDEKMIQLVKEYVFLRTYRTDVINQTLFRMIPILEESARRLSISYDDLLLLSPEEICESLRKGSLSEDIKIEDRKKSWALFRQGDTVTIFQGAEADKFAENQGLIRNHSALAKNIIGQIGYRGVVRGVVKVVITPNDARKVFKGDIMVAVMTFPSYIAAMEKASAFVTDDGGILCHASIVAREMKKPCIIGTKIATKVLKDGDEVEVNANEGMVKIIKRAM